MSLSNGIWNENWQSSTRATAVIQVLTWQPNLTAAVWLVSTVEPGGEGGSAGDTVAELEQPAALSANGPFSGQHQLVAFSHGQR